MPIGHVAHIIAHIKIFLVPHVGTGIAVVKAVRENLVLHGALGPFRHMEAGIHPKGMGGIREGNGSGVYRAGAQIMNVLSPPCDQKRIKHGGAAGAGQHRFIPVKKRVAAAEGHIDDLGRIAGQQGDLGLGVFLDTQANVNLIAGLRLGGGAEKRGFIAENGGKQTLFLNGLLGHSAGSFLYILSIIPFSRKERNSFPS